MYFDEEVVLDLRLNTLDRYVDYFVIVESTFTHRGDKRNLKFDNKKKNLGQIIDMQRKKTGMLFQFCCLAPIILSEKTKYFKKS